ncbi:hypothetical protein [Pallidibacillus pasinlerensis]|uniref:Phage protein n=1 Tax=Pallidibacillus pasinlerensis TaxID=2703818 RepID=A0ABX0A323_9BACI|nr:hypothetical protein [Pallidibacillus pasinlerensis]NCU16695.1 hypothetical protein [Pallidibacillus pasinlerensis]
MVKQLSNDTYICAMSKDNEPVMRVVSGTEVEIETYDCFLNKIESEDMPFNEINWDQVNPATGPIYVEEAVCN